MPALHALSLTALATALTACRSASPEDPTTYRSDIGDALAIHVHRIAIPDSLQPEAIPSTIGLTSSGEIAYFRSRLTAPLIAVLDTSGQPGPAWGRPGEGPGEMSGHGLLFPTRDGVIHLDPERRLAQRFGITGELLRESRGLVGYLPVATDTSTVLMHLGLADPDPGDHALVRQALFVAAKLVPAPGLMAIDSAALRDWRGLGPWPPAALGPGGIAVADGFGYRFVVLRRDGSRRRYAAPIGLRHRSAREVAILQERRASTERTGSAASSVDKLSLRVVPRFGFGAVGWITDSLLVIVGRDDSGQVFVDQWAPDGLRASRTFECAATGDRVVTAISAPWVALLCGEGDDPAAVRFLLLHLEAPRP